MMSVIHDANGRGISSDNPLSVKAAGSDVIQPVDIQARYQQTVQTHNAVSVATGAWSAGSWIDAQGYDKVAVTFVNDASTSNAFNIHWSNDGVNVHYDESLGTPSTASKRGAETATKTRYMRVALLNQDAAAHIMSSWAYLKA